MTFFLILRENGLDWNKSKEIFYNLTDEQMLFLNAASEVESERIKKENKGKTWGDGNTIVEKKSFQLR